MILAGKLEVRCITSFGHSSTLQIWVAVDIYVFYITPKHYESVNIISLESLLLRCP